MPRDNPSLNAGEVMADAWLIAIIDRLLAPTPTAARCGDRADERRLTSHAR